MTEARMNVGGKEIRYIDADDLIEVTSPDEIPPFKNEAEEAAFWDTHTLSGAYWRAGGPQSEAIRKATEISLANNRRHFELSDAMWDALTSGGKEPPGTET